jgi:hypothetical protein
VTDSQTRPPMANPDDSNPTRYSSPSPGSPDQYPWPQPSWQTQWPPRPVSRHHRRSLTIIGLIAVGVVVVIAASQLLFRSPFSPTGSMGSARTGHTATLLPDGRVLVVGGVNDSGEVSTCLASAELYNPKTGTFSPTGSLTVGRCRHTATSLSDGRVLIAGGFGDGPEQLVSAELYDPKTGAFTITGSMSEPHDFHTATLLHDGRVLIAGGEGSSTAELYDPKTGTFSTAGSMLDGCVGTAATGLDDGRVLVVGCDDMGPGSAAAELFDPTTGTFALTGSLTEPRKDPTATLLADGRVLVTGGTSGRDVASGDPTNLLASAEIYDPKSGTFRPTGSMTEPRTTHTATLLQSGQVLIAGGWGNFNPLASAELFNPASGTFSSIRTLSPFGRDRDDLQLFGAMVSGRQGNTATLLHDGRVLLTGGDGWLGDDTSLSLSSDEIYTP